jgi:hypothetical protein
MIPSDQNVVCSHRRWLLFHHSSDLSWAVKYDDVHPVSPARLRGERTGLLPRNPSEPSGQVCSSCLASDATPQPSLPGCPSRRCHLVPRPSVHTECTLTRSSVFLDLPNTCQQSSLAICKPAPLSKRRHVVAPDIRVHRLTGPRSRWAVWQPRTGNSRFLGRAGGPARLLAEARCGAAKQRGAQKEQRPGVHDARDPIAIRGWQPLEPVRWCHVGQQRKKLLAPVARVPVAHCMRSPTSRRRGWIRKQPPTFC